MALQVNLSNDLLFHLVMQEPERCRQLLEMILGFKIKQVNVTAQKTIMGGLSQKGVRLDVFANDENNTRYDVEMQTTQSRYIGRRLRFYQSRLDNDALNRGTITGI